MLDDILSQLRKRKTRGSVSGSAITESTLSGSGDTQTQNAQADVPGVKKVSLPGPLDDRGGVLSTQCSVPTATGLFASKSAEYAGRNMHRISDLKKSDNLKISGLLMGYVTQISASAIMPFLTLSDGLDEILCSLEQEVLDRHRIDAESVLVLKDPSIWRESAGRKHALVLNVTADNILDVHHVHALNDNPKPTPNLS